MNMTAAMETRTNKPLTACTDQEIYLALLDIVREQSAARVRPVTGRKLYYISPSIGQNEWGRPSISYMGMDQKTKRWKRIETYGGKLVENITQAVARDCLAEAISRLEDAGYPVVFHIHDEVVIDAGLDKADLDDVIRIMSQPPVWAAGLPLNADGWVNEFFKKD